MNLKGIKKNIDKLHREVMSLSGETTLPFLFEDIISDIRNQISVLERNIDMAEDDINELIARVNNVK